MPVLGVSCISKMNIENGHVLPRDSLLKTLWYWGIGINYRIPFLIGCDLWLINYQTILILKPSKNSIDLFL